ncbi:hypothetical protein VX037_18615 [Gordonia sp. Z-3]|uniref:hypothetical protein n=1 Tax=Gordonia sp. Z-3 TaxID=3115408 RepID=UPI002E2821F4|nr:hypothetical protein [Gordonia sp. Z-3]MED5803041.1 hypothetical protein [Gordonia sp. Z-3]
MFELEAFCRQGDVAISTHGFGRPETSGSTSAPPLIGFEWADGAYSSNLPLDNAGGLHYLSGGGGPQHARFALFLDHLPPPGLFHVVTAWPYFDLAERQVEFDASDIIDAADEVQILWDTTTPEPTPRTRDERESNRQRAVLEIPRGGWFADHFDHTAPVPRNDAQGNTLTFQIENDTGERLDNELRRGWRIAQDGDLS